ncbi:MAG: hypothetical protein L6R36_005104 [Xanthoria steineri]|nr:MAG: hypothetical protein L6R36_005104 [Xanthoria steineri]
MLKCVRDGGGQGGVVSGIGQSGTVGVILRKNDPVNVVCGEELQTYGQDKCSQLLLSLPAHVQPPRVFGAYWVRAAGQHVDELIPTYYPSSPPTQCRLGIWPMDDLSPMTIVDTATWYKVWQAGIALAGMCARKGLPGRVLNFGVNRRLQITLDDNSDPILKNVRAGVNVTVVHFPFGGEGVRNETMAVAR